MIAVMAGLLAWSAGAVTPAAVVRPDLSVERVHVLGLRGGVLTYFDDQRVQQRKPISTFLQLRDIGGKDDAEPATPAGRVLVLVDDQRLPGTWDVTRQAPAEALAWKHPVLGALDVPLDRVAAVRARSATEQPTAVGAAEDGVVLENGDRLAGFIESVSDAGVTIMPQGAAEALTLPLERVHGMTLANPRQAMGSGYVVTLDDGTRVLAGSIAMDTSRLWMRDTLFEETDEGVAVDLERVVRIGVYTGAVRMRDLQDLPRRTVSGGEVFGVPMPARDRASAVELHAPIVLRYDLPRGATRFAATARLDLPAGLPEDRQRWAGLELVVAADGDEPRRFTLTPQEPTARINLPIAGSGLELRVEPGVGGPILDRLRLEDPVVLVREGS